jgi:tetratricopeptide (TPR) repeat protein
MANTVRAVNAISRKDLDEAQSLVEEPLCALDPGSASDVAGTRLVRRYLRAVVLDSLGRANEALRWFDSIGGVGIAELMLVAPAHLREAKLYERLGDKQSAVRHYRRFVDLWREADAEFQPMVRQATLDIKRLTS